MATLQNKVDEASEIVDRALMSAARAAQIALLGWLNTRIVELTDGGMEAAAAAAIAMLDAAARLNGVDKGVVGLDLQLVTLGEKEGN